MTKYVRELVTKEEEAVAWDGHNLEEIQEFLAEKERYGDKVEAKLSDIGSSLVVTTTRKYSPGTLIDRDGREVHEDSAYKPRR